MSSIAGQKGACPRCHGFMVPMILDGSEEVMPDRRELSAWRCVNCGERIDPLILANRRAAGRVGRVTHPRRHYCGSALTGASSGDSEIVRADSPVKGPMKGGRS